MKRRKKDGIHSKMLILSAKKTSTRWACLDIDISVASIFVLKLVNNLNFVWTHFIILFQHPSENLPNSCQSGIWRRIPHPDRHSYMKSTLTHCWGCCIQLNTLYGKHTVHPCKHWDIPRDMDLKERDSLFVLRFSFSFSCIIWIWCQ